MYELLLDGIPVKEYTDSYHIYHNIFDVNQLKSIVENINDYELDEILEARKNNDTISDEIPQEEFYENNYDDDYYAILQDQIPPETVYDWQ